MPHSDSLGFFFISYVSLFPAFVCFTEKALYMSPLEAGPWALDLPCPDAELKMTRSFMALQSLQILGPFARGLTSFKVSRMPQSSYIMLW